MNGKVRAKQNLQGQEIGTKGALTRAQIIRATATLMEKRSIRDLKVAEIGGLAGVSASTFYLYFESVSDAALAVVEQLDQATPEVLAIFAREWTVDTVYENAKALVRSYVTYWDQHYAILRIRNFVADEGDRRFAEARRRSADPVFVGLLEKVEYFQAHYPQSVALHAPSAVSVLMAMLERTAAIIRMQSRHKTRRPRQIEAAAFLIASVITGGAS